MFAQKRSLCSDKAMIFIVCVPIFYLLEVYNKGLYLLLFVRTRIEWDSGTLQIFVGIPKNQTMVI